MTHKHNPNPTSKTTIRRTRESIISNLANLLWDQTKPNGEEAVPEDQWEAILIGPCNGDAQLVDEVCAYERNLREAMESESEPQPIEVAVPQSHYLQFLFNFFQDLKHPVFLLWNMEKSDWFPEEGWDILLDRWTEGDSEKKERLKEHARKLKKVQETGRFTYYS